jgi:hypothetical protein
MKDNLFKEKTMAWLNAYNSHLTRPLFYLAITSKWTFLEQLIYIAYQHAPNLSEQTIIKKMISDRRDCETSLIIFQGILQNIRFSSLEMSTMIRKSIELDRLDTLQLLLEKDPRHINRFFRDQLSSLFIAIFFNRPDAIKLLIRMGDDPYRAASAARRPFNTTARWRAAKSSSSDSHLKPSPTPQSAMPTWRTF